MVTARSRPAFRIWGAEPLHVPGAGGRGTEAAERHLCPCRAIRANALPPRNTRRRCPNGPRKPAAPVLRGHAGAEPLGPWRRQGSARRPGGPRWGRGALRSRAAGPPDAGASAKRAPPPGWRDAAPPDRRARGTGRFRPRAGRGPCRGGTRPHRAPPCPCLSRPARWPRSRFMPTARCWAARCWGTIDRLIVGQGRVLAVDFKTNAEVPVRPEDVPEGAVAPDGGPMPRCCAPIISRARDRHGDPVVANGDASWETSPDTLVMEALGRAAP